ncbi:MAG: twin-arginine translocation signal domain-containing protein, partial [Planctomycetaceae bacterium]
MNGSTSRRGFLSGSIGGVAALGGGIVPAFPGTARAFANESSNDRPRIGCIGLGSMGMGDAHDHARFGDILAVCDVDNRHAERARNHDGIGKGRADCYRDYRRV